MSHDEVELRITVSPGAVYLQIQLSPVMGWMEMQLTSEDARNIGNALIGASVEAEQGAGPRAAAGNQNIPKGAN